MVSGQATQLFKEIIYSEMSSSGGGDAIYEHCTTLEHERNRLRCKYCGKGVHGFNRLEHHLGGVGPDVVACSRVPDDVKFGMKNSLLENKKERLVNEVGNLYHLELPLKWNFSSPSTEPRRCQLRLNPPTHPVDVNLASENASGSHVEPIRQMNDVHPNLEELGDDVNSQVPVFVRNEDMHLAGDDEAKDNAAVVASKRIGRFFYEAGINLDTIKLPSFQRMIDAASSNGSRFNIPRCNELKGWILESGFEEVQGHANEMKRSWEQTGCSILLDRWTNQKGRTLIGFLVDCPKGTIFLRSVDASDVISDANMLFLLLSNVVEEVGPQSDVQVITPEPYYMEAAGKRLVRKYTALFWTLCADQCIDLILERITSIEHVKEVLDKAKAITRFIYNHALPVKLMKQYMQGKELIRTSRLKSVTSFLTLKNMKSEKDNLVSMFNSSAWKFSMWASRTNGKAICELVKNPSFWVLVGKILKIMNPLIGILHLTNESDTAPIGFLYNSMDQAKLEIEQNLGGEKALYKPFWILIDDVWNNYLNSHLHSAAYYLNPSLYCSKDFHNDGEVTSGLTTCIVCIDGGQRTASSAT